MNIKSSNLAITYAIYVLLISIVVTIGCSNEEKEWNEVKELNSSDAYMDFIISYPNTIHADEIYTIIKDDINQMHFEAWEMRALEEEEEKSKVEELLLKILRIKPKDALALNNLAWVVIGKYYDNHNKDRFREGLELYTRAVENANRQRVSNEKVGLVVEGHLIIFAQPPKNDYELVPLRDIILENQSTVHKILDLSFTRPADPKDLIITGSVVDINDVPVGGQRFWAIEIGGDIENGNIENGNIEFTYNFNKYGRLTNPFADTDEKGQFSFKVGYDNPIFDVLPNKIFFLTDLTKKMDIISNPLNLTQKGKLLVFNIDEDTYSHDLGECRLAITQ